MNAGGICLADTFIGVKNVRNCKVSGGKETYGHTQLKVNSFSRKEQAGDDVKYKNLPL